MIHVLFACHAGPGIGLGHLKRSLVAAKSLKKKLNVEVDFIIAGESINFDFPKDFNVFFTNENQDLEAAIEKSIQKNNYNLICIDAFEKLISEEFQRILNVMKSRNIKFITIDYLVDFYQYTDLIYIPNFLAPNIVLENQTSTKIVYGWDCFLLNVNNQDVKTDLESHSLILTGGSDVTSLGLTWPNLLNELLPNNTKIDWVTGPFSISPKFPKDSSVNFVEHVAPPSLNLLMSQAKAAATIYGVSFYELIASNVPTVVFSPYGDKNKRELDEIKNLGIALVAKDVYEATKLLRDLIEDESLQKSLSLRAGKTISKYSGERFAEEVDLLLRNGS